MSLEGVLARLHGVRPSGAGWKALCPAHADKGPSLSVSEKAGKILLHCFAGCSAEAVCTAAGIEIRELFESADGKKGGRRKLIATYRYVDEKDVVLYEVLRFEPKDFRQRRPDGHGGWISNLNGVRRVLCHLPDVLKSGEVIIVEGEKDAETARAMQLCATTGGAASAPWLSEYTEALRRKSVVIIPDADEPGRKKARQVARSLYGKVESLKALELPGAKDLTAWVEGGGTREALLNLVGNAPQWEPLSVDGGELLMTIYQFVRRFVSLSECQAAVVALWVAHTHTIDSADATPYLAITSAEKQSVCCYQFWSCLQRILWSTTLHHLAPNAAQ
jgi:putative DNA primase/helicase